MCVLSPSLPVFVSPASIFQASPNSPSRGPPKRLCRLKPNLSEFLSNPSKPSPTAPPPIDSLRVQYGLNSRFKPNGKSTDQRPSENSLAILLRGWVVRMGCADVVWMGFGSDVSALAVDVHNENPSLIALGKLTHTNPRATLSVE